MRPGSTPRISKPVATGPTVSSPFVTYQRGGGSGRKTLSESKIGFMASVRKLSLLGAKRAKFRPTFLCGGRPSGLVAHPAEAGQVLDRARARAGAQHRGRVSEGQGAVPANGRHALGQVPAGARRPVTVASPEHVGIVLREHRFRRVDVTLHPVRVDQTILDAPTGDH